MPWVESHTVLARHRKTLMVAYDLKIPVVQVIGHLHVLWHTILEQQEDGDLTEWPDDMIEEAAMWEGHPGELLMSLRARGWIDGHLVHDWLDYTGAYLTKKYSSGNVERLKVIWMKHGYKYGKGLGKYAKQKASRKRAESEREERIPNLTLPNPSEPNLTIPLSLSKGKTPFPQDWRPDGGELEPWVKFGINPQVEFASFRDHALTTDRRCKDWKAAFRNWCRKAIDMKTGRQKQWTA